MSKSTSKKASRAASSTGQDWLRMLSIIIAVLGLAVAGYLSWAELTGSETQCVDAGKINCSAVQNSAYSHVFGIPIAVLGLLGYVAILGVLVLEDQVDIFAAYGRTLVLGFSLFGVIFSLYLTLIEASVLDAWCQWCVASAVAILLLFLIGLYRLFAFLEPLRS